MAKKFVVQKKTGIDVKEYRCKPRNAIAAVVGETDLANGVIFRTDDGKFVLVSEGAAAVYDTYDELPSNVKQQKAESDL
ncbi:MAG: hypothetical protein LUQ34_01385 [Euryarchaeota archaeon]|nr:hypothetical protein [Euryarchaeota archaeon]